MNCRINQKRKWTCRILLESMFHRESVFVTLTYNDDTVPLDEDGRPTLIPEHFRLWIRRFRKSYRHINIVRFFGCGEYGDKTERPHYHAILFGVGLDAEKQVFDTWNNEDTVRGFITISELTDERAAYTAQYTTKKMTRAGDIRLGNRHPEFARMSTNKGIGFPAVSWLATTIRNHGFEIVKRLGDIPNSVRISGKIWPLGEYLRRHVRQSLGLSNNPRERAIQLDHVNKKTGELHLLAETYTFPIDMEELMFQFVPTTGVLTPNQEKSHRQKVIQETTLEAVRAQKRTRQGRAKALNQGDRL